MLARIRQRHFVAVPFLLIALITAVGGVFNSVDLKGRIVDDFSGEPISGAAVAVGQRRVTTAEDGAFSLSGVPRTAQLRIEASGYFVARLAPVGGDIRLSPNSLTLQVVQAGSETEVGSAQIRSADGSRSLGNVNPSGVSVVSPHPGNDAPLLICAPSFAPKEIRARGVLMRVELAPSEGGVCPPLATSSPSPAP